MSDQAWKRGAVAEQLAAAYLESQGLRILARNLRCKLGELDLVCLDRGVLAIVEVRQRMRIDYGGALASVDHRKQRKLMRAARYFLLRRAAWRGLMMRFDVVGVQGPAEGPQHIVWIKDAFRSI
ncbi:MAG TPA: YraN family protein [Steroidobacteraceae bacterium]